MVVAAMALLPSPRARSWAKVKIAKHLFEHRYDYRAEWLRFTETLGGSGAEARPLGSGDQGVRRHSRRPRWRASAIERFDRLVRVGLRSGTGTAATTPSTVAGTSNFWDQTRKQRADIELDAVRDGGPGRKTRFRSPQWMLDDPDAWLGVPLIHKDKVVGLVLLAAPEYRRPLDWEDFDLLRTAGRQAASSLAEAQGQRALSNAQRFEEFNRRFAFILHDIKNLVSQLSLLTRNAERHADNAEFRADMIATLKGSVGKMNDLLARLSPQASTRPLAGLSHSRSGRSYPRNRGSPRSHEVRLLGDCGQWAQVDSAALEQALGHLLQNAIEASPPDSPVTVRVRVRRRSDHRNFDKGCGMDADFVRNQLFQPFASTKPGGFGIGAFEARSLVTAMGGRISVESRPGEGTQFTIHLPGGRTDAAEQSNGKSHDSRTDLPVLLIVEDDEGLQRQLKWAYDGYRVVIAGDRASAIEALRLHEPAVVTLDLGLPPDPDGTEEGFATLAEMLALKPGIKIIVASGHGARESALTAVALGAYDFYRKPIDIDELGLIVASAFHLHGIEEENRRLEQSSGSTVLGSIITARRRC
jgi:signal transduction histidine kinase/ActR/RegA family two-component response regulator